MPAADQDEQRCSRVNVPRPLWCAPYWVRQWRRSCSGRTTWRGHRTSPTCRPWSHPPQWLGRDHDGDGLWPAPDDGPEGLNVGVSPDWLTEAAGHVRTVLRRDTGGRLAGHGDWEAQNVFWDNDRLAVVHDWDSLAVLARRVQQRVAQRLPLTGWASVWTSPPMSIAAARKTGHVTRRDRSRPNECRPNPRSITSKDSRSDCH